MKMKKFEGGVKMTVKGVHTVTMATLNQPMAFNEAIRLARRCLEGGVVIDRDILIQIDGEKLADGKAFREDDIRDNIVVWETSFKTGPIKLIEAKRYSEDKVICDFMEIDLGALQRINYEVRI